MRVYQFRHIRVATASLAPGPATGRRRGASLPSPPVSTERLQALLESAFPDAAELRVIDRGGGDHFEVRVTAPAFDGL